MINLEIQLDKLKIDYPLFYNFFKESLNNSQSRFKNYKESRYRCYYYVESYMKPSQKTKEYYKNLYKLKWDDRKREELKKTKVIITMVVGKFAMSDQTNVICDTIKPILDQIISRKIYIEQTSMNETDNEIINSIPDIENLKQKIEEEIKMQKDFIETLGFGNNIQREKNLTPQDRLKKLIDNEDYEGANEIIKKHPELKKSNDTQ